MLQDFSDGENSFRNDGENFTQVLLSQVDFYKRNHVILQNEIKNLISDNKKLSEQVEQHMLYKRTESEEKCIELQKQIHLLNKEKESLRGLWQASQKTIQSLEAELKAYQSESFSGYDINRIGHNYNDLLIKDLEKKLASAIEEAKRNEKTIDNQKTEINAFRKIVTDKEQQLASIQSECQNFKLKAEQLDKNILDLNDALKNERSNHEEYVNYLELCKKNIQVYELRECEAKSKVTEALGLLDLAIVERDLAFKTVQEKAVEISTLQKSIESLTENFNTQLNEAKNKYEEKVYDMLQHIQQLTLETYDRSQLLTKTIRECRILQSENDKIRRLHCEVRRCNPRPNLVEARLEAIFQELVLSEKRNIQLSSEKQCAVMDIQQLKDSYHRDIRRRDWEDKLQKNEIGDLKLKIDHLQKSLDETHLMVDKLQAALAERAQLNERVILGKEGELEELNKHLEEQIVLNKKWRDTYKDMTAKLQKKIEELQKENGRLKEQIKLLSCGSEDIHHDDVFSANYSPSED